MAFSFATSNAAPSTPSFTLGSSGTAPFGGTTPGFGANTARPASTGFSFGAASTPSLFSAGQGALGAPSTTPGSAFSFGNQPAQTGSTIFGGTTASTFGLSTQTAAASSTSAFTFPSFGATTPAPQTSIFGTPQQQQLSPSPFNAGLPPQPALDLTSVRELEALRDAFIAYPGNRQCIFNYFFLNVVENVAARVKPDGVNELRWREALQRAGGPDNPDHLYPVQANGFKDLLLRKTAQDEAVAEHEQRLQNAVQMVQQLERKQETVIHDKMEQVERKQRELRSTLLKCIRYIDVLESRFANARGYFATDSGKQRLDDISREIAALEIEIEISPVIQKDTLRRRLDKVQGNIRLRGGATSGMGAGQYLLELTDDDTHKVYDILSETTAAIDKFQAMLDNLVRDIAVLANGKS